MRILPSASLNGQSIGAVPCLHAARRSRKHHRASWSWHCDRGRDDEAMAAANGLIDAAEATHNPQRSRSR